MDPEECDWADDEPEHDSERSPVEPHVVDTNSDSDSSDHSDQGLEEAVTDQNLVGLDSESKDSAENFPTLQSGLRMVRKYTRATLESKYFPFDSLSDALLYFDDASCTQQRTPASTGALDRRLALCRSGYFDPHEVFSGSAQQFRDRYDARLPLLKPQSFRTARTPTTRSCRKRKYKGKRGRPSGKEKEPDSSAAVTTTVSRVSVGYFDLDELNGS